MIYDEQTKKNCLRLRYAYGDADRTSPQPERHREWVKYVRKSHLTPYEQEACITEFLTLERHSQKKDET